MCDLVTCGPFTMWCNCHLCLVSKSRHRPRREGRGHSRHSPPLPAEAATGRALPRAAGPGPLPSVGHTRGLVHLAPLVWRLFSRPALGPSHRFHPGRGHRTPQQGGSGSVCPGQAGGGGVRASALAGSWLSSMATATLGGRPSVSKKEHRGPAVTGQGNGQESVLARGCPGSAGG